MKLDDESLNRLTEWILDSPHGTDGDNQLIKEFVATLIDGSWRDRWFRERDVAPVFGSEQHVVQLRAGLRLVVVLDAGGEPGLVQILAILAD